MSRCLRSLVLGKPRSQVLLRTSPPSGEPDWLAAEPDLSPHQGRSCDKRFFSARDMDTPPPATRSRLSGLALPSPPTGLRTVLGADGVCVGARPSLEKFVMVSPVVAVEVRTDAEQLPTSRSARRPRLDRACRSAGAAT